MNNSLVQLIVISLVMFGLAQTVNAQTNEPTAENPFGHLGRAGVVPASQGMYDAFTKTEVELQKITEKLSKDASPSAKDFQQLYRLYNNLNRWISILEHYREPVAVDLRMRSGFYVKALFEIRNRFYATPPAPKEREKAIKQLTNGQPARQKALVKTMQTLQSGEPKQAEKMIEQLYKDVYSISGVLQDPDKKPFYEPIAEVAGPVSSEMAKFRTQETADAIRAERSKFDEMLQSLMETLASGTGVEGLTTAASQWKQVHLQRLKIHAFSSSGGGSNGGSVMSAPRGQPGSNKSSDDGMAAVKQALADYLSREANNAAPSNGLEHYLAIQQVLAELTLRVDDDQWSATLERGLEALAKKCQISSEAYNYRMATDELLRWRQRTASEWAASMPEESIATVARREMASTDQYAGLYDKNQQTILPVLLKPIPNLVPDVQSRLVGKPVRTSKVVPIDGAASAGWLSRIDEGYYCNLSVNAVRETVAPLLRKELLCDGENRPLSLAAASAILSADAGLCDEAGGILGPFAIESYISRMCNIPESHSNLVPLGSLGIELSGDSRRCLLLRWNIAKLGWIKHKYLLVSAKAG